jgi:hypothetical protein
VACPTSISQTVRCSVYIIPYSGCGRQTTAPSYTTHVAHNIYYVYPYVLWPALSYNLLIVFIISFTGCRRWTAVSYTTLLTTCTNIHVAYVVSFNNPPLRIISYHTYTVIYCRTAAHCNTTAYCQTLRCTLPHCRTLLVKLGTTET